MPTLPLSRKPLTFVTFFFLITILILAQGIEGPKIQPLKPVKFEPLNEKWVSMISLGHNNSFSDYFWFTFLLKANELEKVGFNLFDDTSWEYRIIRTSSAFDPRFCAPYKGGSNYLMILKLDFIGAENMLHRGIRHCEDKGEIYLILGYLYTFDKPRPHLAAQAFLNSSRSPKSPSWVKGLAARLFVTSGDLDKGELILTGMIRSAEGALKKELIRRKNLVVLEKNLKKLNELATVYEKKIGRKIEKIEDLLISRITHSLPKHHPGGSWVVTKKGRIDSTEKKRLRHYGHKDRMIKILESKKRKNESH